MKQYKSYRITSLLKSKRGMSIVSVMAAFVILLLSTAMFTGAALLSFRFTRSAEETKAAFSTTTEKYYTGELDTQSILNSSDSGFTLTDGTDKITFSTNLYKYSDSDSGLSLISFGKYNLTTQVTK